AEKLPADWAEAPDEPATAAATMHAVAKILRTKFSMSISPLDELMMKPPAARPSRAAVVASSIRSWQFVARPAATVRRHLEWRRLLRGSTIVNRRMGGLDAILEIQHRQ